MVNREETLKILKEKADHEESLARNLIDYCEMSRDSIEGLTDREKGEVMDLLEVVMNESNNHREILGELIEYVEISEEEEF